MLGMTLEEIALSRKLLGRVVFETMPAVLGQSFHVERVEDFENGADLLPLIELEGVLKTSTSSIRGTLLKYGFVDLRFKLTQHPIGVAPVRTRVLSRLFEGAVDRNPDDPDERFLRIELLEMLCEDLDAPQLELTVVAEACQTTTLEERIRGSRNLTKIPAGLFPQQFQVTDAYITNAPSIGLQRNFYW